MTLHLMALPAVRSLLTRATWCWDKLGAGEPSGRQEWGRGWTSSRLLGTWTLACSPETRAGWPGREGGLGLGGTVLQVWGGSCRGKPVSVMVAPRQNRLGA